MIKPKQKPKDVNVLIRTFEKRYRKGPDSILFFPLADAYCKAKKLDKAEDVLRKGLFHHPNYWAAKALLGEILFKNGDIKGAKQELEAVIKMVPENMIAQNILLEIYKKDGSNGTSYNKSTILKFLEKGYTVFEGASLSEVTSQAEGTSQAQGTSQSKAASQSEGVSQSEGTSQPEDTAQSETIKETSLETIYGTEAEKFAEKKTEVVETQTLIVEEKTPIVEEKPPAGEENTRVLDNVKGKKTEVVETQTLDVQETQTLIVEEKTPIEEEKICADDIDNDNVTEEDINIKKLEEGPLENPTAPEIVTATLAELYFSQGLTDKAVEMYKKLVLQKPDRSDWAERLKAIKGDQDKKPKILKTESMPDKKPGKGKDKILGELYNCLKNCQYIKKVRGL